MPKSGLADFVDFQDASLSYDGKAFALDGLSLTIPQGQFVCLLGGNGSGKSTLAKCMNAMLAPGFGQALVFGCDVADADSAYYIRSNAGLVMQNPDDQLVASIVESEVAFGPENLGVELPELAERVQRALEAVGLEPLRNRDVSELSGGQRQRVAVAGALAMEPALLILDEATSMLDSAGRADLLRVCRELHDDGMTIVMITHFMEEAALADRVVVLDEGRVCVDGSPDDVLARASELRRLHLEVPFAAALSVRLRDAGIDVPVCIRADDLLEGLGCLPHRCAASSPAGSLPDGSSSVGLVPADEGSLGGIAVDGGSLGADDSPCCAPKAAPVAISLDGVGYSYGSRRLGDWALRDVSFQVRRGEFVGVAGRTGSGKSTLLQLMGGLLRPAEGRVLLGEGCGFVGLVFQHPERQLFAPTVREDVAFGPCNQGLSQPEIDKRVEDALLAVGLDARDIANKSPFELSGGQQRRVAIAGILAMRPSVLVLDEPTAGLDPRAREELLGLISSLHAGGITCVMVSHSMDDLARMSQRIIILGDGRLLADGSPSDVLADPDVLEGAGLEPPAAQSFAIRARAAGWPLPRRFYDEAALADGLVAAVAS